MALDEYLFGKIFDYLRNRKRTTDNSASNTVFLNEIQPRFTILARALTGKAINIFQAEREGGYKNNNFFLPASFSVFDCFEDNLAFYFFRLLYITTQKELKLNWHEKTEITSDEAKQKAIETAPIVLEKLFYDYPMTIEIHNKLIAIFQKNNNSSKQPTDLSWLYGKWMQSEDENNPDSILKNINNHTLSAQNHEIKTTLQAKAIEQIKKIEIDKKQQEDYVMNHNFEKVDTAEEHSGVWRDFDGEDELKEHQKALDELNMNLVVRVDDPAHAVYQADFTENLSVSESTLLVADDFHFLYNEWNYAKNSYKVDYCKVFPAIETKSNTLFYTDTIQKNIVILNGLRKTLATLNNKREQVPRQYDGEEFDLDALNDFYIDIYRKQSPEGKIFIAKQKKEKELSILLLLDISLSSDGYVNGNKILEIEKQVAILFGEILNEYNVDFAIHGFHSKTRNHTTFISFKDFDTKWDKAKYTIGSAEPTGYTRIGAALRHSGFLLKNRKEQNKWIILLSDGKPNDYDKYEGKYGIQDVKQALSELKSSGINAFALAIEAQAKYYLPQMFGQNHYQILATPAVLLPSLVKLFDKIKNQ